MNTESRHKDILFLVSLSPDIIFDLKNKNFDYSYFLNQIRSFNNVDYRESISKEDLTIANQFKIVIVVGHRKGDFLELSDRTLFPLSDIVASLPSDFTGVIDVSVCNSTDIHAAIKMHCPRALVQTANEKTGIDFRLPLYSILLNRFPVNINYRDAYLLLLERMEAKQNLIPKQELENRQTTTKLGMESKEDIRTSVFMPKNVTRGEFFKLQIKMHLDIDTGTLYFEEAEGNDPNTFQRKKNVAIKNVNKGDELFINLCFLDAKDMKPTKLIIVKDQEQVEDYYLIKKTIKDENPMLQLHVKVTNEYPDRHFFTTIKFLKDGKPLIDEFNWITGVNKEESHNGLNTYKPDTSGEPHKQVRPPEKVDLQKKETKGVPDEVKEFFDIKYRNDFVRFKLKEIFKEYYKGKHSNLALIEIALYDHEVILKHKRHKAFLKALKAWGIISYDEETEITRITNAMSFKLRNLKPGYMDWPEKRKKDKNLCKNIGNMLGKTIPYMEKKDNDKKLPK